jgi:hypothetical protein
MNHVFRIFLVLSSTLLANPLYAADPDFYLLMTECQTTVGALVRSDESLKTVEGTPVRNACVRTGKEITCRLVFADGEKGLKGESAKYTIVLDSPPDLYFTDEYGGDWVSVNTANHRAVLLTRVLGQRFAGSKVCHGFFTTQSEIESLEAQRSGKD